MRYFECPKCGLVSDELPDTRCVQECRKCHYMMTEVNMLKNLPPKFLAGKKSPTVILKDGGVGWVGKDGKSD